MRLFNKVAIIGTGLIGGSLALVIKKNGLAREVVGVARHKVSLDLALKMKAIDRGSLSLGIIKGADLIILATPIDLIISQRNRLLKIVSNDCIVTDVGSTKGKIVSFLEKDFKNYIGSHPLAGSEKRGIKNARRDIFKESVCILTPTKRTRKLALEKIKRLWLTAGARVILLSPEAHDNALSFTSHLAHIVAFSLINSIPSSLLKLSSGGLRDTTRIASSSPELWPSIFLTNAKNTLKAVAVFEKNLNKIKIAIRNNDKKSLTDILRQAQKKRTLIE
ncbi:MAG: prephenate dehydrogenase [Candidatus Omnitrophica bacterium]|nr:prephenate dehydrogenase [Candidatus Omnitrophota bacterium]